MGDNDKAEVVVTSKVGETPTVEYKAPADTSTKNVVIPETVTSEGIEYAVTAIAANAFKNIHKKAVVKVPKSKLKAYKKLLKKVGVKGKKQKIK